MCLKVNEFNDLQDYAAFYSDLLELCLPDKICK
jgi:hypothetical protein